MNAISYNKLRRSITAILIAFVLAFAIDPTPANAMELKQPKLYKVTIGTWGATGAELVVEKTSVSLRFDCAEGNIPVTLNKDKKGVFKVEGTYTRRGFGPIRINNPPKSESVMYEGKVTGRSMKIKITEIATGAVVGEYTLTRGREARIRGCR